MTISSRERMSKVVDCLSQRLLDRDWRLVTAESCTGGWIAKSLTDVAGSSEWFDCGLVTYSNQAKERLLGVSSQLLFREGAVSEAVVKAMAAGALDYGDAVVAVSGIAGPGGGSAEKPVGTVWLAWATREAEPLARCFHFVGNRCDVRLQAVSVALQGMNDVLECHG